MRHYTHALSRAGGVHHAHHARPDLERLDDRCLLSGGLPAGSLDPSFALGAGYVLNAQLQSARAMAIQSNGSVLVGSDTQNRPTGTDFQITRYTSTGQIDRSFGNNGVVVTDFAGTNDQLEEIVVDNIHGTIYAVGEAGGSGSAINVGIARYTMDGKLDPTFGMGGKVTTTIMGNYDTTQDYVETAVLDSQGKLIVGGMAMGRNNATPMAYCASFLTRFNLTGFADVSFGAAGKVMGPTIPMVSGYRDEIWDAATVLAQPVHGASIITVGVYNQSPEVCQFSSTGSMVASQTLPGGSLGAVAFAPDGTWFASASTVPGLNSNQVQLNAYSISGVSKFPTVTVDLGSVLHLNRTSAVVNSAAIDGSGRIVLGGEVTAQPAVGTFDQALLMRFTPSGKLDNTFGSLGAGVVTTDFGPGKDAITQVAIQSTDNKILAAGQSQQALSVVVLARYLGDPVSGTSGGSGGAALAAQSIGPLVLGALPTDAWGINALHKGH